jgi:hypothetical protein
MIAPSGSRRKRVHDHGRAARGQHLANHRHRHGIVSRIIMTPYFCPRRAPESRHKTTVRWPGPFGSGFLSPQPPGAVGIGPIHNLEDEGPTRVGPFAFQTGFHTEIFESRLPSHRQWWTSCSRRRHRSARCDRDRKQTEITAATYRRRRASAQADRGCRPGHRQRRRRHPRARCCPTARSSVPARHSSRRSWSDFAPRCNR